MTDAPLHTFADGAELTAEMQDGVVSIAIGGEATMCVLTFENDSDAMLKLGRWLIQQQKQVRMEIAGLARAVIETPRMVKIVCGAPPTQSNADLIEGDTL